MNYKLHYDRLISNARLRLNVDQYTEKHHIIPKCMGGGDTPDNLVRLTAKEHFVAHHLLWKEYRTPELAHAWFMMLRCDPNQKREFTAKQHEAATIAHVEVLRKTMVGSGNHFYGRKHTEAAKAKISRANTGKAHTQEFRDAYSKRFKGIPKTPEHRAKIGRTGLSMYQNIETGEIVRVAKGTLDETLWVNPRKLKPEARRKCTYCDFISIESVLKMWHDGNCRWKDTGIYVKPSSIRTTNRKRIPVTIDGVQYKSINAAAKALGVSKYEIKKLAAI